MPLYLSKRTSIMKKLKISGNRLILFFVFSNVIQSAIFKLLLFITIQDLSKEESINYYQQNYCRNQFSFLNQNVSNLLINTFNACVLRSCCLYESWCQYNTININHLRTASKILLF